MDAIKRSEAPWRKRSSLRKAARALRGNLRRRLAASKRGWLVTVGSGEGDGTATRAVAAADRGTRGASLARVARDPTPSASCSSIRPVERNGSVKGDGRSDDGAHRQDREHGPTTRLVEGREGTWSACTNSTMIYKAGRHGDGQWENFVIVIVGDEFRTVSNDTAEEVKCLCGDRGTTHQNKKKTKTVFSIHFHF